MDQELQPGEQTIGDRLLKALGLDPNKWTVGDRRLALLGIGIGLTVVIIAVCGYVFGWKWTGLAKRTFWDYLSLLIGPIRASAGWVLLFPLREPEDAGHRRTAEGLGSRPGGRLDRPSPPIQLYGYRASVALPIGPCSA